MPVRVVPAAARRRPRSAVRPNRKKFDSPASWAISIVAPSRVPTVKAPFIMNFMLPVPLASKPAVEICSETSLAGIKPLGQAHVVFGQEEDLELAAGRRIDVDHGAPRC